MVPQIICEHLGNIWCCYDRPQQCSGLLPTRWPAIVSTDAELLLTGRLGTNFNDIQITMQKFSFEKMCVVCEIVDILSWPQCVKQSSFPENTFKVGCYVTKADCHMDGLVQERCNSIANAMELRLPWTNPLIWHQGMWKTAQTSNYYI